MFDCTTIVWNFRGELVEISYLELHMPIRPPQTPFILCIRKKVFPGSKFPSNILCHFEIKVIGSDALPCTLICKTKLNQGEDDSLLCFLIHICKHIHD